MKKNIITSSGQSKSIIFKQRAGETSTSCPTHMCNSWAIKRIWDSAGCRAPRGPCQGKSAHESLTLPANVSEFPDTSAAAAFCSASMEITPRRRSGRRCTRLTFHKMKSEAEVCKSSQNLECNVSESDPLEDNYIHSTVDLTKSWYKKYLK